MITVRIETRGFAVALELTPEQVRTLDEDGAPLAKLIGGLVRAADECEERARPIETEGFEVAS